MFANKPAQPVIRTIKGFVTILGDINRSIESIKIVKHNASKKTALINAPNISALCQPYE